MASPAPLRVLHLIDRLDGDDTEQPLRGWAVQQAEAGVSVEVVTLRADRRGATWLRRRGVEVVELEQRWSVDPFVMARLAAHLRRPIDLVHAWGPRALKYAAALRRCGGWQLLAGLASPLPERELARRNLTAACRRADAIAWLDDEGPPWAERARLVPADAAQIPRGVAPSSPPDTSQPRSLLAESGIAADARLIGTAGPLIRSRSLDEAIWAFELVRILEPRACLVIAGDGPDRRRLERFAYQVGDPRGVVLLGPRDDWREWLACCEVHWEQGASRRTPEALLEALAEGKPTVCADVASHRVAVVHRHNGLLARLGDRADIARHTLAVLEDSSLARRLGAAAAESAAQNYPWAAVGDAWRGIYARLAGPLGGPHEGAAH